MADEIIVETTSAEVIEVGVVGPQGPQGPKGDPGDVAGLPLSTQGDMLYRGASQNERLPIGTTGQILRVSASGVPEWGAAPASGVSSVSGKTGAVLLDSTDILTEQALQISDAGVADCNGVFVYGGLFNGRPTYYATKDTFVYWDGSNWVINHNGNDQYFGTATTYPWGAVWSLSDGTNPLPVVTQAASHEFEQVVGQRTNPTARGDAASKNVGTGANDVAAGNHTHVAANVTDFNSAAAAAAPVQSVNGNTGAVTVSVPSASSTTPSALGVAAAGSSNDFARADHVHPMPTANDLGLGSDDGVIFNGITVAEEESGVFITTSAIEFAGEAAANTRNQLGLGTAATADSTNFAAATHAASHASAGSDPLAPSDIGAAASNHTHILATDIATALAEDPDLCRDSLNLGDMATEPSSNFSAVSHGHGNLSSDGKLGSTAGLPVVTTTAGAVTTLALGTAGQVLTVNSGANGVEFAAASGGGVSSVSSSASDVLGVSGANITGVDANADRIVFWDDSASKLTHLEVGSGLSISGTTLTATSGGGSGGTKTYAVFTAEHNQPPSASFATLDTRNSIAVLDFSDTATESAVFVGVMPEAAVLTSGLIVRLYWMGTATTGDVRWSVAFERGNTDLDADSFDTATAATATTNATSGIVTVTSITCTNIDGITAGDLFRLRVQRLGADAADTMAGAKGCELVAVEIRSAA